MSSQPMGRGVHTPPPSLAPHWLSEKSQYSSGAQGAPVKPPQSTLPPTPPVPVDVVLHWAQQGSVCPGAQHGNASWGQIGVPPVPTLAPPSPPAPVCTELLHAAQRSAVIVQAPIPRSRFMLMAEALASAGPG